MKKYIKKVSMKEDILKGYKHSSLNTNQMRYTKINKETATSRMTENDALRATNVILWKLKRVWDKVGS